MQSEQSIDNMVLEMRRGVIVLAVLSQCSQEQYGYSLMKSLAAAVGNARFAQLELAPGRCPSTPLL
jgi:hypothetical protein